MDDNFDEFGNVIGPEYSASEESANEFDDENNWEDESINEEVPVQVYEYDTHDINTPLVKAAKQESTLTPPPEYWDFQSELMKNSLNFVRTFQIRGSVNHGKTSILQALGFRTYESEYEQNRSLTLSNKFYSNLVANSDTKSYVFNVIDTPGHVNYKGYIKDSECVSNGTVLVVDVVEGFVPLSSLKDVQSASVLVVNKLDRLITELRLPPKVACDRIFRVVEASQIDPEKVVFCSAKLKFSFTIKSMKKLYADFSESVDLDFWEKEVFTEYVLNPLYKLISAGLVGPSSQKMLNTIGINIESDVWETSYDNRIHEILLQYFTTEWGALVDKCLECIPVTSPKNEHSCIQKVNNELYRIRLSDTNYIAPGYFIDGQCLIPLSEPIPGVWNLTKLTDTSAPLPESLPTDPDLTLPIHVCIELLKDTQLAKQKLNSAIHELSLISPGTEFIPTETGEIVIKSTGELYLDNIIHTLRHDYKCDLRCGHPSANFRETVQIESPPVTTKSRSESFEIETSTSSSKPNALSGTRTYHFDSNVLTIADSVEITESQLMLIVEAFEWCCASSPLIEESLYKVQFHVSKINFLNKDKPPQILPTARKAFYKSLLLSHPRIVEPYSKLTVIGLLEAGRKVYKELAKRRGRIINDAPIYDTNLYIIECSVPTIDTFALEIDIGCQMESQNHAYCITEFDHWSQIPSNPLNPNIQIHRLKISNHEEYAKDIMLKTRFRKHLTNEPNLEQYLDTESMELVRNGM